MRVSINDITKLSNINLWRYENKYYRLFAKGITPNNCWLIAPVMIELIDIDVATGKDVYGADKIEFDVTGTVSMYNHFITRS